MIIENVYKIYFLAVALAFAFGNTSGWSNDIVDQATTLPSIKFHQSLDLTKESEILYGLVNDESDHVILSFRFDVKNPGVETITSSCGCAEVVSSEVRSDKIEFLVDMSLPVADGMQSVSFTFASKKNKVIYVQQVAIFKGKAKCIAGRLRASTAEFKNSKTIEIPFRILGAEQKVDPIRVTAKFKNEIIRAEVRINEKDSTVVSVLVSILDPAVGILWIDLSQGNELYRTPFLITE